MVRPKSDEIKIALSVIVNIFSTDGTTVRPKRVAEIFKKFYDVIIFTRANEIQKLNNFESTDIFIVKPDNTKLWNLKLIPIVIKNKFEIIYCSNDWFGFITYYFFRRIFHYKIIFEAHSIFSGELKEQGSSKLKVKLSQILEKFVVKNSNYVIALSENTLNFYQKYNVNINLIPVFINQDIFKTNNKIENEKDQRQNFKIVGLIGPFNSKANKYFLDFLYDNLNSFDKKIVFHIVGECEHKIIDKRITYTGYLDSISDYVKELCYLDAVLIPSRVATLGPLNKIVEPMACSLPIFTTPKGLVGLYYTKNGIDIFVFEENEIIDKINKLIFNHELMKKIGNNARIIVEKYYSNKINEARLIKIIENLINC